MQWAIFLANPALTWTPLLTQGLGQPPTLYGVQLCIPEKSLTHCGCHVLWDNFVNKYSIECDKDGKVDVQYKMGTAKAAFSSLSWIWKCSKFYGI